MLSNKRKIYILKNDYDNANDYITSRFNNSQHFEFYMILALCNLITDGDFKSANYNINKMWELIQKSEPKNPELYYKVQIYNRMTYISYRKNTKQYQYTGYNVHRFSQLV